MSTKFSHGVDDIIAKLLWANRGIGTDPAPWEAYVPDAVPRQTAPTSPWPVFSGGEPNTPDETITVYETTPLSQERIQVTGEQQQLYGFTVRVRGKTKTAARQKAEDIRHDFNEGVYDQTLTLGAQQYLVQSIAQCILVPVGRESGNSTRWLVNLNCLGVILAYPVQG